MIRRIFVIIFISITFNQLAFSQISISYEKYNALKEIQKIPDGMTYDEFLKIQRDLDWSKIFVATVVPGYIHFYIKHTTEAWIILATRTMGYGLITYAAIDQYKLLNNTDVTQYLNITEKQNRQNRNAALFATGILLNFVGLFYDLAIGSITIENERNEIYFKYGLDEKQRTKMGISYNSEDRSYKLFLRYNY